MWKLTTTLLITLFFSTFAESKPPAHDGWHALLAKHVSVSGNVDYRGFIADSVKLNTYLRLLSLHKPDEKTWSINDQKAFWINAYNAFTVKLIVDNYPVKSISEVLGKMKAPDKSPWDIPFIKIGNERYSLNIIEHEKLRKAFGDARFHFVLVCAAKSCPVLLNAAYTADKLESQLERQTKLFINDKAKNKGTSNTLQLSKLFEWYAADFESAKTTVIDFYNSYASVKVSRNAKITYLEYSWDLNE